ncbi:uncharacterized protein LAESUDRAFT_272150 [Laetiporus sulphureus 93-53]|uniref:Uncharacterized protein n=1 Tax=Laetiporus sulphureus 93-53 TaxID=1314785 RepID=A0A165HAL0_9APHY|nr:uncharacterized protein LAESUDRAFT_272150 [Laetiporus sulphureus 93-53]KZT11470.1 hypothetical protein LAESUDRAFT_272150 [Laetiporus sulphureus 93-53]
MTESTSQSPSLLAMARNKLLSTSVNGVKDSSSLHRWVLLRNSLVQPHTPAPIATPEKADVPYVYRRVEDEGCDQEEEVAFMFPDPDALSRDAGVCGSENDWLDSLLEDLGEDDDLDAEEGGLETSMSGAPPDEDDEPLSPLYSPMSSSDNLVDQSSFYVNPHAIPIPYPIPYPPVRPSLVSAWYGLDSSPDSLLEASSPLYHDPLPYYDVDDTEDLPVPDAIEDTSDDESDAPATPFDHSTSSICPLDPASVPLPSERRRRSHSRQPQVYVDTDDSYFYPFGLDPLPSHVDNPVHAARVYGPSVYQQC